MRIDVEHAVDVDSPCSNDIVKDADSQFVPESTGRKAFHPGPDRISSGQGNVRDGDTVSIRSQTTKAESASIQSIPPTSPIRQEVEAGADILPSGPLNRFIAPPYVPPEELGLSSPSRGIYSFTAL